MREVDDSGWIAMRKADRNAAGKSTAGRHKLILDQVTMSLCELLGPIDGAGDLVSIVVDAFLAASRDGDFDALLAVLGPERRGPSRSRSLACGRVKGGPRCAGRGQAGARLLGACPVRTSRAHERSGRIVVTPAIRGTRALSQLASYGALGDKPDLTCTLLAHQLHQMPRFVDEE
jgi:hypothetical protein